MAAQPVTPGFMRWRWAYWATSLADSTSPVFMPMAWGRGPTIDISPRSTLNSCGSSSRLVLRMNLPTLVTRSSSALIWRAALASALVAHRAELPDEDGLVVEAVAALAEEDRAGAVQLHGQGDQQHDRPGDQQAQAGDDQVLGALDPGLAGVGLAPDSSFSPPAAIREPRRRRPRFGTADVDEQAEGVGQHVQLLDQLAHAALGGPS
jgi:hypothetical protein